MPFYSELSGLYIHWQQRIRMLYFCKNPGFNMVYRMEFLTTERINFRKFTPGDFENLLRLDGDPQVMKHIGNGSPSNPERTREVLKTIITRYNEWKTFGLWAAELKSDSSFIGWFALKPLPQSENVEVGYRLLREHWGKGYATEGAKKLIEYGFTKCGLEKIVAITHPENESSKKVLRKCGLIEDGTIPNPFSKDDPPHEVCYFEIRR